jgi:hypothetical protein
VAKVRQDGIAYSDEALLNIEDAQFDSDKAWVTGYVPRMKQVDVAGDTTILHAWFKSEAFEENFRITVYVEYEEAEELATEEIYKALTEAETETVTRRTELI